MALVTVELVKHQNGQFLERYATDFPVVEKLVDRGDDGLAPGAVPLVDSDLYENIAHLINEARCSSGKFVEQGGYVYEWRILRGGEHVFNAEAAPRPSKASLLSALERVAKAYLAVREIVQNGPKEAYREACAEQDTARMSLISILDNGDFDLPRYIIAHGVLIEIGEQNEVFIEGKCVSIDQL